MDQPILSAAIMGRNESRFIDRCLESLVGVVDELVYMDTGSTDDTVERVLNHALKFRWFRLHHWAWRDDFSAARNEVAAQVRGRWILSIDCDEYLTGAWTEPGQFKAQLQELERRYADEMPLVILKFPMLDRDERETVTFGRGHHLRCYPKTARLRYEQPIHNRLVVANERHGERVIIVDVPDDAITMIHRGYDPAVYRDRRKSERAMNILMRQVDEGTADDLSKFYIGRELCHMGDWAQGLPWLRECLDGLRSISLQGSRVLPCMELILRASHESDVSIDRILDDATEFMEEFPNAPDLFYLLGTILFERNNLLGAIGVWEDTISMLDHPAARQQASRIPYKRWELFFNLAQAYAVRATQEADAPPLAEQHMNRARYMLALVKQDRPEMAQLVDEALKGTEAE